MLKTLFYINSGFLLNLLIYRFLNRILVREENNFKDKYLFIIK